MNKWTTAELATLCNKIGDGLHGTPVYSKGTGYHFINGNNLENGKINIYPETKEVSSSEYRRNYIELNENTLLIGINGTLGNMSFYRNEQVMLGKSSAYINFKNDINRFYYYYFQLPGVQKYFYSVATGSTIKNLSLNSLKSFIVPVPNPSIYRKIVAVMSVLDDKIELNRRMNAELEQMARTLYDYWFIQFDFPDSDGKPYKSSGGAMKHSPELNRQIPADWEVLKLQDVLEFEKGTEPGAAAYSEVQNDEFDMPFYRVGDIDGQTNTYIDSSKFTATTAEPTDVIVTFDGSVGKMGLGLDGAISGGLRHIYDKSGKFTDAGVYAIFGNEYITKTIERYATGSVILHASSAIPYLMIPYDEKVFSQFQKAIEPMFAKIIANRQQSQTLASLRDWLLPMLMNGQVSVK